MNEDDMYPALFAAAAAIVSALLSYVAARRKTAIEQSFGERDAFAKAQAGFLLEQSGFRKELRDEVDRLREQVEALEADVRRMRAIISQMDDEIDRYRATLREHGIPLPRRADHWRFPNDTAPTNGGQTP